MVSDKILDILMRNEYMSAKAISLECKCSDKTVRTRIKNINMILKGATIISQPRKGYFLQIFNEEEFKKFLSTDYYGIADQQFRFSLIINSDTLDQSFRLG